MKFFRRFTVIILFTLIVLVIITYIIILPAASTKQNKLISKNDSVILINEWQAPDTNSIASTEEGNLIRYGKNLISNTSYYFGPKGTVAHITNGMNCQNCHLDAGLKPYGNCFSAVASTYPTFRPRSGIVESIEFRINDCLQRSLNGKSIDGSSKEMRAMVAYLKWIGNGVPKGSKPKGAGTEELAYLNRAADPINGKIIYEIKCQSCHGKNGEGLLNTDSTGYVYPPLWGNHSYNTGAGLYRLTKFAGYVKNSMPFGASHQNPQLTNVEAWDVAAFINSQSRPKKSVPKDWPSLSLKAIDYPFGPYTDSFSETQHKFGPYGPIKKAKDEMNKQNKATASSK
ncbi:MAG: c-type cytochrome [Chitinophagaceae bacterium]